MSLYHSQCIRKKGEERKEGEELLVDPLYLGWERATTVMEKVIGEGRVRLYLRGTNKRKGLFCLVRYQTFGETHDPS